MEPNLHLRISILSPGPDVTPLKFRGWLRGEAADIDLKTRNTGLAHQVSIIRLFMPNRLRLSIGQKKLDKILQDIVDRFETIYRIELEQVDAPLSMEELVEIEAETRATMEALREQEKSGDGPDAPPTVH